MPSSARVRVILRADGCAYDGPAVVASGLLAVELVNQVDGPFDLDLWRLDDGHSYAELAAHIEEEQRRGQAGEPPVGHPTFADLVAEETAAGTTGSLETNLSAGTYGFACILQLAVNGGIWAAGPMEVSG
jgi:hypothetical protein